MTIDDNEYDDGRTAGIITLKNGSTIFRARNQRK